MIFTQHNSSCLTFTFNSKQSIKKIIGKMYAVLWLRFFLFFWYCYFITSIIALWSDRPRDNAPVLLGTKCVGDYCRCLIVYAGSRRRFESLHYWFLHQVVKFASRGLDPSQVSFQSLPIKLVIVSWHPLFTGKSMTRNVVYSLWKSSKHCKALSWSSNWIEM